MTGSCSFFCTAVLSLLFALYPNSFQAKISPPSFGDRTYVSKGSDVTLAWTYDFPGKTILAVQWFFSNNFFNSSEALAHVAGGKVVIVNSSLPIINVIKPATLVLRNVSLDYNGSYRLEVTVLGVTPSPFSDLLIIILEQPNAAINCAQNISVDEGGNFTCLCNSTNLNGNPPPIASWSKDGGEPINGTGYLSKQLSLKNVSKTDIGTYKCKVKSHSLEDKKTIQVDVKYGPTFINFTSNVTNNSAEVADYVKLTCLADGNPKPNYNITFVKNPTFEVVRNSIEGILIINNVNINGDGLYRCIATNNFGGIEAELFLNVTAKATQSTTTASSPVPTSSTNTTPANSSMTSPVPPTTSLFCSTEKAISDKNNGGTEWYIVVITLFCGIGIGVISCYTVMWLYRRRRENKDPKPSEARKGPETHDNPSVYQELDLQRMNKEDNYQSLRKASRPVNRQEPTAEAAESSYQELDKVRGSNDDNNYQSLNRV